jgi:hypothetical protein
MLVAGEPFGHLGDLLLLLLFDEGAKMLDLCRVFWAATREPSP